MGTNVAVLKRCAKCGWAMLEGLLTSSFSVKPRNVLDGILASFLTHFDAE